MPDQTSVPAEQVLLMWKAPIQPRFQRTRRWYAIASVIVLAIAGYGLFTGAWTMSIVALLCAGMYMLVRNHELPDATIVMTEHGVQLGTRMISWDDAKGFWLVSTPTYTELHIVSKTPRTFPIKILTGTTEPALIRQVLQPRMPELTNNKESLLDMFIRICKL